MIFLIDSTTSPACIGLWDGKKLTTKSIESTPDNNRKLVSIIEKFVNSLKIGNLSADEAGWKLKINSVGVICGPGGFTGVRTGVVIANTIGYALKAPIYALDTLTAQLSVGVDPRVDPKLGKHRGLPLQELNNVVSLLSASNSEVFFARFNRGKMVGKIELIDVMNLPNRLKDGDLIVGDLGERHCEIACKKEFKKISSKERLENLLQMILPRRQAGLNNKIRPVKQALPLYIKKPNITTRRKVKA